MKINGVPVALPRHIDHYINMPRSELAQQSPESLCEMDFEINSQIYHLQNVVNHQAAKIEKCNYEINKIITPVLNQYKDIYGNAEKRLAAIADNSGAKKWHRYEMMSRAAVTRLSDLTKRLEGISKTLNNLQYTKRR